MKRGLVLEGGAMRGLFTAGVLDVLMERGVRFDGAIGVSAGACFGCNYKSGLEKTLSYLSQKAKFGIIRVKGNLVLYLWE